MANRRTMIGVLLLGVLTLAHQAQAWSTKEHILLTRLAAARLLADESTTAGMKDWLRGVAPGDLSDEALRDFYMNSRQGVYPRGVDGVAYWSVVPDLEALTARPSETVAPFGVPERVLHYLDLELFDPHQQGEGEKPAYKSDLSALPRFEDIPRDMNDPRWKSAGMLPFRVEQVRGKLVEAIAAGRLDDLPGRFPRDDHAAKWAGYLAHYLADNTQPQHATVDYKSKSYLPAGSGNVNLHAEMEYKLCDDAMEDNLVAREKVWGYLMEELARMPKEEGPGDAWAESVETSREAYGFLPLIGEAGAAVVGKGRFDTEAFYAFEGDVGDGLKMTVARMKAHQQARAVVRIAAAWKGAWIEANAKTQTGGGDK